MATEDTNQIRPFVGFPFAFSNNVSVGTTLTEMVLTFSIGNIPTNIVYLSLPVAKHLSMLLNNSIADYERKMGQEILSVEQLYILHTKADNSIKTPDDTEQQP